MTDRTCAVDEMRATCEVAGVVSGALLQVAPQRGAWKRRTTDESQPRPCSVDGCESDRDAQGLCSKHYQRFQKWGTPDFVGDRVRGEAHPQWKDDDIGYGTAHERTRAVRGSASGYRCCECGAAAAQWAYDHEDPDERASDMGRYSVNPDHYRPMCVPCHKRFDLARLVG